MPTTPAIDTFFKEYEQASNALDLAVIDRQFADTFLYADPNGSQPIKKADFLAAVGMRHKIFGNAGLQSTDVVSLEESFISPQYSMVKTQWTMHFIKEGSAPIDVTLTSSFLLQKKDEGFVIILYIPHQDVMKALQEKGVTIGK